VSAAAGEGVHNARRRGAGWRRSCERWAPSMGPLLGGHDGLGGSTFRRCSTSLGAIKKRTWTEVHGSSEEKLGFELKFANGVGLLLCRLSSCHVFAFD
jgi:hypothetical protein